MSSSTVYVWSQNMVGKLFSMYKENTNQLVTVYHCDQDDYIVDIINQEKQEIHNKQLIHLDNISMSIMNSL